MNYLYCLIIPLTYLFVQLNFDLISHNFGIREVSPVTTNNYLTLSVLVTLYYLKSVCIKVKTSLTSLTTFFKKNLTSRRSNLNVNTLVLAIVLLVTIILYLPSFYPLINNIFWKCLQVNLLNSLYTEYLIMSFLWVIVLTLFTTTRFILVVVYATFIAPKVLLLFTYVKPSRTYILHFFTITLLLSTFVYNTSVFTVYGMFGNAGNMQNLYVLLTPHYNTTYNNYTVITETTYYASNYLTDYVSSLVDLSLGNLPQNFLHLSPLDDLLQSLNSGSVIYPFVVNILEISSAQTNIIFLMLMVTVLLYSQLKLKIVF
jgi:hypothetical protein